MRKTLIAVALLALASGAMADRPGFRYRWVDANGLPQYSDSLTAEAMKAGYDVVNDHGLVVQHVNRQLTPEERAEAAKKAEEAAIQQRVAEQHARDDDQMLSAYPTVDAYIASQKQGLDSMDQQISNTRISLHNQEKTLADLLSRAGDMERSKQPVPPALNANITKQRDVVNSQRNTLNRQLVARDAAVEKNANDLQHYRELRDARTKAAQPSE